ncbi:putative metal responsive transcript [Hyalella azteca]|nr:putative metal responsive transcript [Hyalella azteca]
MMTPMDVLIYAHADVANTLKQFGFEAQNYTPADAIGDSLNLQPGAEDCFPWTEEEDKISSSDVVTKTVKQLTRLHELRSELHEAKNKLHQARLSQQSSNLLNIHNLEERISWCSVTMDHLASLSSKRDLLLYYLQQPPAHSCLTMPRKHHREFEELLQGLCQIINNTCTNASLVQRCPDNCLPSTIESCVSALSQLHGSLRMLLMDLSSLEQLPNSQKSVQEKS